MIVYLVSILTVLFYLFTAFTALRRWKRSTAIRRFALLIALGALWLANFNIEAWVKNETGSVQLFNFLLRFDFIIAPIIAFFFASFTLHFPNQSQALSKKKELLLAVPAFVLGIINISSDFIITEGSDRFLTARLPTYWIYIGVIIIYFFVIGINRLINKLNTSRGVIHLQLVYIVLGAAATLSALVIDSIINAVIDIDESVDLWVSNLALIFIGVCAWSVLKHRLLGIRFLIKRGAVIGLTMFILFFFYTYLILSLQRFLPALQLSEPSTVLIIVLLIVASYPFLGKFARRFSKTLFAESYALKRDRVTKKIRSFTEKTNFLALFTELAKELQSRLPIKDVRGLVLDQREGYIPHYPAKVNPKIHFNRAHPVIHLLRNREHLLVREELPFLLQDALESGDREQLLGAEKLLYGLDAEVVVLLGSDDNAPAMLAIGEKKNGSVYTIEEIALIKEICGYYTNDFQNFFMYQQALRRVGVEV